ncbi:MAG: phosphoenolpyruvate--protein phosphotransferase [Phycisphaerae bacterium]
MRIKKGIGVSSGVAVCQALILRDDELRVGRRSITPDQVPAELQRLLVALEASKAEIRNIRDTSSTEFGPKIAAIFGFHLGMLEDKSLLQKFTDGIEKQLRSAEYSVSRTLREYANQFQSQTDSYFRERVNDLSDIEKRVVSKLTNTERRGLSDIHEPTAIVAHDLTPSQTASLDKSIIRGIAIDAGGQTSHTAIIANSLGIPAVVGLQDLLQEVTTGDILIINGTTGVVIVNPDEATLAEHRLFEERQQRFELTLNQLRDLPAKTRDGVEIQLMGNIEFPHEVDNVLEKGAVGIGLYRTEFLYLASEQEPTEDDHYAAYAEVIRRLNGKPLVIRTLDLGADKYTSAQALDPEDNPFLGCRSIRLCLANQPMFKTQLRAILRVSVLGDVRVMFPMITTPMELRQAKMILKDVQEELEEEGIAFNPYMPVGMMIEVPSAAIMCQAFSRECDFFSLGTNDLIQYTLAVDRGNQKVAALYTGANPAVLSLIRNVVRVGTRANIGVSLCGELGGDREFTMLLLGLGLRTLSITPHHIPEIKKIIRSVTITDCQRVARRVGSFEHQQQIMNFLREETRRVMPEAYGV